MPYLGRGLDLSLFDLDALRAAAANGAVAVQVTAPAGTQAIPGLAPGSGTRTLDGPAATAFGGALSRQFTADARRGHYGGEGMFVGGSPRRGELAHFALASIGCGRAGDS